MNDLILLGLLFDGPKHGYQLKREAGFLLGHGDMHNNLVYPLLRRFAAQGWVSKKTVPGERGQTRRQYDLTAKGRVELVRRLSQFGDEEAGSAPAFSTRVGMFELLGAEARTGILDKREAYLRGREKRLTNIQANLEVGTFGAEAIKFLRRSLRLELDWIGRLRRKLNRQKKLTG
jgi:DNA-binding PadR family transcriptional regulator